MMNTQALKDRLHLIAKEKKIPFNLCWKQFLLERFLARLSASEHASKFIFKGGFLLSYLLDIGRETTDLDFLLTRMRAEENELKEIFDQILAVHSSDGFVFSFDSIELLQQPHMEYAGYRVVLNAALAKMRDKIQVDVGVGDAVDPLTLEIPLVKYRGKPFYENALSLLVYPTETIFSEKLETILSKGAGNSRMKDYHDLILLVRTEGMLDRGKLKGAIEKTFACRGTFLKPIQFDPSSLKVMQRLWAAHLKGIGDYVDQLGLPKEISSMIEELNNYLVDL